MRTMTTALALACAAAALCGQGRADEIYSFAGTPVWQFPNSGGPTSFDIALDITDAQAASGSFALHGIGLTPIVPGAAGPTFTGDTSGFVSLAITGMDTATLASFPSYNFFDVAFTFAPNLAITSDTITFGGDGETNEGTLSGSSGYLGSDGPWCNASAASHKCTVAGSWTNASTDPAAVPEPATFALLGVGLLGLRGMRRRAR